jgi:hypothetical protein
MVSDNSDAMTLTPGSLILEGIVADYNAHLRAKSHCELYRVRQSDFMIAVISVSSAGEWFYRFRLLEREARERFHMRLKSAKGALQCQSLMRRPWRPHSSPVRGQRALENAFSGKLQRPGTAPERLRREESEADQTQRSGSCPPSIKPLDASDATVASADRTRVDAGNSNGRRRLHSAVKVDRSLNGSRSSPEVIQRSSSSPAFSRARVHTQAQRKKEKEQDSQKDFIVVNETPPKPNKRGSILEKPPPVLISSQFASNPNSANLWTIAS